MKLLHVLPSYAPGGHRTRIALLAQGLGAEFSHHVVPLDGGEGAEPPERGISLIPFAATASHGVHLGTLRGLRRLLHEERPQVLITYNWGAIEAALVNRLARVAAHLHCEDGFSGAAAERGEPRRRALFRRLVLGRSQLVVPSRVLAGIARSRWGVAADRISLIRNGIDTERFAQAQGPRGQRPEHGVTIGLVTRLSREKNIGLSLRAFARLSPASGLRLVIAGDGVERAALEAEAVRLGIAERTRFLGQVRDPANLFASFDIFLLSSWSEQLPFSLLEAMAAGLPVAATDVGDVREALAPANRGLVVPPGDEAGLAQRLRLLAESAELRRRLGAANAERARTAFDHREMVEAYRSLLQRIADPRLSSGG